MDPIRRDLSDPHEDHVTKLLQEARSGDASATEQLFALIYEELRTITQHQQRRCEGAETLNTTALVHEAFLKLLGTRHIDWQSRAHPLAVRRRPSMRRRVKCATHKPHSKKSDCRFPRRSVCRSTRVRCRTVAAGL